MIKALVWRRERIENFSCNISLVNCTLSYLYRDWGYVATHSDRMKFRYLLRRGG